jgi:Sec-independent protein secretion pathway component TatC
MVPIVGLLILVGLLRIVSKIPGYSARQKTFVLFGVAIVTLIAAILTPTPDVPSMMIRWAPLMLTYMLGNYIFWQRSQKQR